MKPFAIKINSEEEYDKVKKYALKWGYELDNSWEFNRSHGLVSFCGNLFQSCHSTSAPPVDDWKKAIRKNSLLTIENICVRIDTPELVKEVWEIIKDCGLDTYYGTKDGMSKSLVDGGDFLFYDGEEFINGNQKDDRTEITPKQLKQLIWDKVKKGEGSYLEASEAITRANWEKLLIAEIRRTREQDYRDMIDAPVKGIDGIHERLDGIEERQVQIKRLLEESMTGTKEDVVKTIPVSDPWGVLQNAEQYEAFRLNLGNVKAIRDEDVQKAHSEIVDILTKLSYNTRGVNVEIKEPATDESKRIYSYKITVK